MAIKRNLKIQFSLDGIGDITLEGDAAQSFLTAWQAYLSGANTAAKGVPIIQGTDKVFVNFRCLCHVTQLATTTEEVPDIPCTQVDCIADYPPTP